MLSFLVAAVAVGCGVWRMSDRRQRSGGSTDNGAVALHGGMIKKNDVAEVRVRMRLGKSKFGVAPIPGPPQCLRIRSQD